MEPSIVDWGRGLYVYVGYGKASRRWHPKVSTQYKTPEAVGVAWLPCPPSEP